MDRQTEKNFMKGFKNMKTTKTLHLKFGPHAVCKKKVSCSKIIMFGNRVSSMQKSASHTKNKKRKEECVQKKQGQKDNTSKAKIQNGSQKDSRRTANGWKKESKRKNHLKERDYPKLIRFLLSGIIFLKEFLYQWVIFLLAAIENAQLELHDN